jgi:hypothetical protein
MRHAQTEQTAYDFIKGLTPDNPDPKVYLESYVNSYLEAMQEVDDHNFILLVSTAQHTLPAELRGLIAIGLKYITYKLRELDPKDNKANDDS